jgi:hypothetical protein
MSKGLNDVRQQLEASLTEALWRTCGDRIGRDLAEQTAADALAGREPSPEFRHRAGSQPVCAIVSFDADRIQGWVFASERVQVAKGASSTLEALNADIRTRAREIPGICGIVYSAGGGGMLFADASRDLAEIEREVRQWFESRSHELTFTVTSVVLYAQDLAPSRAPEKLSVAGPGALDRFEVVDGVRGALVRLQVAVRRVKDAQPQFRLSAGLRTRTGTAVERCPSCNRRPPGRSPVLGDDPEYWCPWCRSLREAGRGQYERDGHPMTFSDLAEASARGRRYLGFVAIDGNGMGNVVQGMRTFLQLRVFSDTTTRIYEHARHKVQEVLANGYLARGWTPEQAHLSLLSGGDEITLVLPASAAPVVALETLRDIEQGFERECVPGGALQEAFADAPDLLSSLKRAGAAAGIVAARPQFPVRLLRRYADDLQKTAKQACGPKLARSAVEWSLLNETAPLFEETRRRPDSEMTLEAHARLLGEVRMAARQRVPLSAFWTVLAQCRKENESIASLSAEHRQEVLSLLAANFFRYQSARHDGLRAWWDSIRAEHKEPPEAGDGIAAWFKAGGASRLERLLDLLTLQPFPESDGAAGR